MSVSVQARAGRFQLRVKHKLLPKPFFSTFDTEPEARAYGQQLQRLLKAGIVPQELAEAPAAPEPLLTRVVDEYQKLAPVTPSDTALLASMRPEIEGVRGVTTQWVDAYLLSLKTRSLTPGTIRKRIGVLARVWAWHIRRSTRAGEAPQANPLRMLPAGYSQYGPADPGAREDQVRDRRLAPDEQKRILAALAGQKRQDRERALTPCPHFTLLFWVILLTGMRLREAYTLRWDQVRKGFIVVEGTKGTRGRKKPRVVPISPELQAKMPEPGQGRVFPFWDGTPEDLRACTLRLSARFAALFRYAEVDDFTEHDLRHEATCRWYEMRRPDGAWVFGEVEIMRIMGWSSTKMALRYASLRGEDLAARFLSLQIA
jgi:integrase